MAASLPGKSAAHSRVTGSWFHVADRDYTQLQGLLLLYSMINQTPERPRQARVDVTYVVDDGRLPTGLRRH